MLDRQRDERRPAAEARDGLRLRHFPRRRVGQPDLSTRGGRHCRALFCPRIGALLAEGVSQDEILRDFPYLEPDDIKATLAYAARQADHAVLQS